MNAFHRAKERVEEQTERLSHRIIKVPIYKDHELVCIRFVHVDDTKGADRRQAAETLLKHFELAVGNCKVESSSFTHASPSHEHKPREIFTHQYVCIYVIKPIGASIHAGRDDDALCDCVGRSYTTHIGVFYARWLGQ